jgi:hypothetical protein
MANLIVPRVILYWGGVNLTLYTGDGFVNEPLVYEVNVDLALTNSNPTASFKWNASGAGYKVYEKFLNDNINDIISIIFYYEGGRSISFEFIWSGHDINYGNNMDVSVKLRTQLDGLINGDIRNVTQAPDKPAAYLNAVDTLKKQYGLDQFKDLVRYSEITKTDMTKAQVQSYYRESETFGSSVSNLVQQNGNLVFANNIKNANLAVISPFTWEAQNNQPVYTPGPTDKDPDPTKRYGYLLGPGIINEISRSAQWTPPQANNLNRALKQPNPTGTPRNRFQNLNKNQTLYDDVSKKKGATRSASSAKLNPGVRNARNPDGPTKQMMLQQESQCKLQANVFMHPFMVGVKPADILYVPSLMEGAKYIEDWIVNAVTYHKTDGGVQVSLSASRVFAKGGLMSPSEEAGGKFQKLAASLNLPGKAGLDAWRRYAWNLPYIAQ